MSLIEMMAIPLEKRSVQIKKPYRPDMVEVQETFDILNCVIFESKLRPTIQIKNCLQSQHNHGLCESYSEPPKSIITINNIWYCKQWMIMILAHEMAHQYQWDVIGEERIKNNKLRILSHGPSFFVLRARMNEFNIPLKRVYDHHVYLEQLKYEHRNGWQKIWRQVF